MITESLLITALGMGGVFFFLVLLTCFMNLLSVCCQQDDMKRKALAILIACQKVGGKYGCKK